VLRVFLVAYSLFTLGIVYEALGMDGTSSIDIPYSTAISGERTGLSVPMAQGDVDCVKWMLDNYKGRRITADYNGMLLMRGYFPLEYKIDYKGLDIPDSYVFCTKWNQDRGQYVIAGGIGLRTLVPINYTGLVEVYRSRGAVVYGK
jgi:hypothetical protein